MKKKLILSVIALVIVFIGLWSVKNMDDPSRHVIKVGRYYWPGQYWAEVAAEKGWFAEAGLTIELVDTNPDFRGSQQDVINGILDTQDFYVVDLMLQSVRGADLAMVLNADTSIGAEGIVARKGISSVTDLKGKKVGVEKELATEYILYTLLKQEKLDVEDLEIVNVKTEEMPEKSQNGELDAVVLWEPLITDALKTPGSSKIWDTGQSSGIISAVYVFRKDFIEKNPDDVMAFVKVWHKATEYMKQNPDEAYAIVAAVNSDTADNARAYTSMNKALDLNDNLKAFSYSGGFKSLYGQIKLINLYLQGQGISEKDIDAEQILEPRFIQELGVE